MKKLSTDGQLLWQINLDFLQSLENKMEENIVFIRGGSVHHQGTDDQFYSYVCIEFESKKALYFALDRYQKIVPTNRDRNDHIIWEFIEENKY